MSQGYVLAEVVYSGKKGFSFDCDDLLIVNVGSIGQPRERDRLSCFCVFDDEKLTVEFHRFFYPYRITKEKIIIAGLPAEHALRLGE